MNRLLRAGQLLAAAGILVAAGPLAAIAAPAAAAPTSAPLTFGAVSVQVTDVTPSTPARRSTPSPLVVSLTLTNRTATPLSKVQIRADRGDPIGTQAALDTSLAQRRPAGTGLDVAPTRALTVDLAAGAVVKTAFVTTASLIDPSRTRNGRGLCLCDTKIYPLVVSAHSVTTDGDQLIGAATTYLPSIFKPLANRVQVSWVWPLIDRPHRSVEDSVFTDDALSASVAGGALDRSLQVIEQVPAALPMTLVVDPELLDELEVMATGKYTVRPAGATVGTPGTGADAASAWLGRFTGLLHSRPALQVALTPYADPDVRSLADAGLSFDPQLPDLMAQRVATALGGINPLRGFAWPAANAVDRPALDALTLAGTNTALLDSASVNSSTSAGTPLAVAKLKSSGGSTVTAALTSPAIQSRIARSISAFGGTGTTDLPALVAEVAIRAIQDPAAPSAVVLTPPRYVDPDVAVAVRLIEDTSSSLFSTPVSLTSMLTQPLTTATSRLRSTTATPLPDKIIDAIRDVDGDLPVITALLGGSPAAQPLVATLPIAFQRLASSAWRPGVGPFGPSLGLPSADRAKSLVTGLVTGVKIVPPSSGNYTLASSNAKLPITVQNRLQYAVRIQVQVTTQNSLPGYSSRQVGIKTVAPGQKLIIQVPSRVERSGRIPVQAQLTAPGGVQLGPPVRLYVHSTVFGTIGIVITVGAGAVLVLALILRAGRRVRSQRRKRAATGSAA